MSENKHPKFPSVDEVLKEEYLKPYKMTVDFLANSIGVDKRLIQDLLDGKKSMTVELSIRLGKFLGLPYMYFINIQNEFDLLNALEKNKEIYKKIIPFNTALL